jgi:hypothetical protein
MSYDTKFSDHIPIKTATWVSRTGQLAEFQDNVENLTYQLRNRCFSFQEYKAKHKRIKSSINEIKHQVQMRSHTSYITK